MPGDSLQSHGIKFEVDASGGVWIEVPFWGETIPAAAQAPPRTYLGLELTKVSGDQRPGTCGFDVLARYEGISPEFQNPEDEEDPDGDWEVDTEWSENPIKGHHLLDQILKAGGGSEDPDTGEIRFPKELPGAKFGDGRGLAGGGRTYQKAGRPNLYFGLESYFETGAVLRRTRTLVSVPSDVFRAVGQVIARPPIRALAQVDWGDRNWLVLSPSPRGRGNAVELSEQWRLSGPGGWTPVVYGLIDRR